MIDVHIQLLKYSLNKLHNGSGWITEASLCITVGSRIGGGGLERCAWQNICLSLMNIQDFQKWILFFFQACFIGKLQLAKLQTVFVTAGLLAVERTTSLLHSDRWYLWQCSAQFSDKNTLCNSHFYRKSVGYEKVCLQLRNNNLCPVFSFWPDLANFTATTMRRGF
jgi:hypothetical protein